MSKKRKINSDEFLEGIKTAFSPLGDALKPIGKEVQKINDNFTNTFKKELKPVTEKFKTKIDPLVDKTKSAYNKGKEYIKSEEGQNEILNNTIDFAKAYRDKYSEYFALEEQVKKYYPDAEISFDISKDEFASKAFLKNYKTLKVATKDDEFKVRYYPETGKIKTIVPKKDDSWFQLGAFEDGYQFGDITKTAIGTAKDLSEEAIEGALKIGEGIVDTGATVSGVVGDWFGADDYKEKVEKFVAKDIIDEEGLSKHIVNIGTGGLGYGFDYLVEDEDNVSLLGEKSEALANSAGQLVGQIGLQSVGVPWWLTTGTAGFGGGAEQALREGADLNSAAAYGIIQAGADIITEKIFGGSGLGERSFINVDGLTKGVSGKVAKVLLDYGIDIATEGGEEVFAKIISDLGEKLTYNKDKEITLRTLFDEEALDSFISGTVLGSITNAGKAVNSIKQDIDYRTGLTDSEQKVFIARYKDAVDDAKVKNDGKELTGKERSQIYNNTLKEIKSGEVSVETIESALGGEEYSTYKKALNNYGTLKQELSELQSTDNKIKTEEQVARETDIKQELGSLKNRIVELKDKLKNKVSEKIDVDNIHLKGRESYLGNSYNERLNGSADDNLNNGKESQKIDEDAFIEGIWDNGRDIQNKDSAKIVENSQLESVENIVDSGIIEETVDTGVPGEYTDKIVWGIFNHHPVRKFGKGYYGKRVKQHYLRVDNYELKINPNNESYYLQHPDGRYVQFENMVDNVLQDGKCVLNKKRSFYHVYDYGYIAQKRVLDQANRQVEAANAVGYKVEWLISDKKAVEQISRLFKENNINISVKFYPE